MRKCEGRRVDREHMRSRRLVGVPVPMRRSLAMAMPVHVAFNDRCVPPLGKQRIALPNAVRDVRFMAVVRNAVMVMAVPMPPIPQFPQRAIGYPEAEPDQREAGEHIDGAAETRRAGGADGPHREAEQQRRCYMPQSRLRGSTRSFTTRPSALPCQQCDRQPVVWNDGMQHADADDTHDEQDCG